MGLSLSTLFLDPQVSAAFGVDLGPWDGGSGSEHLRRCGDLCDQPLQGSLHEKEGLRDVHGALQIHEDSLATSDLLIYLKCDVRAIRKQIQQRGRPSELDIPVSYIRRLNGLYEDWIVVTMHPRFWFGTQRGWTI